MQLAQGYRAKSVDPREITQSCIETARNYEHLNYFIRLCTDKAVDAAEQSSKRWQQSSPLSTLDGIPIAVKDNYCVRDMPTTCASK